MAKVVIHKSDKSKDFLRNEGGKRGNGTSGLDANGGL
jgi:hypothetical protein